MSNPTETSPLLAPPEANSNGSSSNSNEAAPAPAPSSSPSPLPASEHFKRPIKIIIHVILLAAILDLIFIITTDLIVNVGPFSKSNHSSTQDIELIGIMILLSLILSLSNLKLAIPNLLNLVLDGLLALYISVFTREIVGYMAPDYGSCGTKGGYQPYPPPIYPAHCHAWKVAVEVLVIAIAGLSSIVGFSHLILLILRTIAVFRSLFWRRPFGLYFPTGELTVSLSIKVLKQQPPIEEASPARPLVDV